MQDITTRATSLKRPQILVRAAKFGLNDYVRDRHLKRCLKRDTLPTSGEALVLLCDLEKQLNSERATNSNHYSIAKHIDILTAIMAETVAFQDNKRNLPV